MHPLVATVQEGRSTRVTYDNSERGNSFSEESLEELVSALESAAGRPDCTVIRLAVAGANFCGGWDTRSFGDLSRADVDDVADSLARTERAVDRIRALPVPVVAAVRGKVIGFGAGLLDAVHVAIAAESTTVLLPEVRFGFAPAGVGHRLTQALPRKLAYPVLLGLTSASAHDLLRTGMVSAVTADDAVDQAADRWTAELSNLSGEVVRAVLAVVASSTETGVADTAYRISARTIVSMADSAQTASTESGSTS